MRKHTIQVFGKHNDFIGYVSRLEKGKMFLSKSVVKLDDVDLYIMMKFITENHLDWVVKID